MHQNAGSGVGAADADLVQSAVDSQGAGAVGVDAVGAHALVAVDAFAGGGFAEFVGDEGAVMRVWAVTEMV